MPPGKRKRSSTTTRSQAAQKEPSEPPPKDPTPIREEKEEEVPTSFGLRDPLPVLKKRQSIETLPDEEYKSVFERYIAE